MEEILTSRAGNGNLAKRCESKGAVRSPPNLEQRKSPKEGDTKVDAAAAARRAFRKRQSDRETGRSGHMCAAGVQPEKGEREGQQEPCKTLPLKRTFA